MVRTQLDVAWMAAYNYCLVDENRAQNCGLIALTTSILRNNHLCLHEFLTLLV